MTASAGMTTLMIARVSAVRAAVLSAGGGDVVRERGQDGEGCWDG